MPVMTAPKFFQVNFMIDGPSLSVSHAAMEKEWISYSAIHFILVEYEKVDTYSAF